MGPHWGEPTPEKKMGPRARAHYDAALRYKLVGNAQKARSHFGAREALCGARADYIKDAILKNGKTSEMLKK